MIDCLGHLLASFHLQFSMKIKYLCKNVSCHTIIVFIKRHEMHDMLMQSECFVNDCLGRIMRYWWMLNENYLTELSRVILWVSSIELNLLNLLNLFNLALLNMLNSAVLNLLNMLNSAVLNLLNLLNLTVKTQNWSFKRVSTNNLADAYPWATSHPLNQIW